MCEYLGRTGYLTPILHCRQWGNIKWKDSKKFYVACGHYIIYDITLSTE